MLFLFLSTFIKVGNVNKKTLICIIFGMNDLNLLKNLCQVMSNNNPKVKRTISMLEVVDKINREGLTMDNIVNVLSQSNPKLKPLLNIIKAEQKHESEDFVQYNH